jgi:LEA14-like dessication related protein
LNYTRGGSSLRHGLGRASPQQVPLRLGALAARAMEQRRRVPVLLRPRKSRRHCGLPHMRSPMPCTASARYTGFTTIGGYMLRRRGAIVIGLLAVWVAGCAGLAGQEALRVTLAGLESLPGQGMEVRMAVKLRLQNPNDTPVNFNGAALTLEVRGMDFASGVSDVVGTVPRFGETVITVPVTVPAFAMARQVISLAGGNNARLDFVARGKLADGSFGGARFESSGSFDLPAGLGSAAPRN